jgi:rRNA processing protein Gar1
MFSVKMSPNMKATAFKTDSTLFIDGNQLLPLSRFLPKSAAEEKQAKGTFC